MDRRNFFKIVSTASAGVAATSCGKKEALIPLLVPEHQIAPGEEQWHPSVCTECSAGCGVIVRVMEGERIVERNGQKFRERIASIKKIEGNPLDPVSSGALCARGQAAVQSLYNPDRVRGPMHRTGDRGKAAFSSMSWDDGIAAITKAISATDKSKVVFLTTAPAGSRLAGIQRFLQSIGAPAAYTSSLADFSIERQAAQAVFGWTGMPDYHVSQARYVLGVGADFLGGWVSPVYYGGQFGRFRQGRLGIRGKLVQAESRMSLTAASADEWLPVRPGFEPHLLVAVGRLLLEEKLARAAEQLPPGVTESILGADLQQLIRSTGVDPNVLRRVARELGESEAPLVIGGASVIHSNSFQAIVASHYLNIMLGNVGRRGGPQAPHPASDVAAANPNVVEALKAAQVVFLDGENPVYTLPPSSGVAAALASKTIISFGSFIDDSAAYADVILPSHHPLEAEAAVVAMVGGPATSVAVATPFVRPLYDTRPLEQTLGDIARKLNVAFEPVTAKSFVQPLLPNGETWDNVALRGGLWLEGEANAQPLKPVSKNMQWSDPTFSGDALQFPLQFQPYLSVQYHDGRGANLPWMQELPDPASSAMWGLPVEIDPKTATKLNVATGDWVRVESANGKLDAPAYVHPAALPGVVSMAIGEGHTHYGRYASGRGANPISILAPAQETSTGVLAFGATRVRVARLEQRPSELIQFSPQDREQGPWGHR
ncbi:MAG TPA: molybdopterin-dependent oxidoreductase [Bryobacteraceae bacterium]|jgi:anaerobic selenocysteine-containing dehydrogenase|nr:molybdopterin-dependent oxidoreductase [Bryobacteraceae bacterium]